MRIIIVGASSFGVLAAEVLTKRGHEIALIDRDPEKIEELSDVLDCGLVTGDGSRPAVLEEVGVGKADFLFCLSDSDEANILAALVGRSLGCERVVPKLEEPDLEPICTELGLDDVIVPDREVAISLADLVEGIDNADLTTVVRSGLRFFGLHVPEGVDSIEDLELPEDSRVVALTRGDESQLVTADTDLKAEDELVLVVAEKEIDKLRERFDADANDNGRDVEDA